MIRKIQNSYAQNHVQVKKWVELKAYYKKSSSGKTTKKMVFIFKATKVILFIDFSDHGIITVMFPHHLCNMIPLSEQGQATCWSNIDSASNTVFWMFFFIMFALSVLSLIVDDGIMKLFLCFKGVRFTYIIRQTV